MEFIAPFFLLLILPLTTSLSGDITIFPLHRNRLQFPLPIDSVLAMAQKDRQRLLYLSNLKAQKPISVPLASGLQVINLNSYVVRVKLGTPAQSVSMIFDTSSDAAWVPCTGCTGCPSTATFFSPNVSTTYVPMDCSVDKCGQARGFSCPAAGSSGCLFNQTYGGGSIFSAYLVQDMLTVANDVVPDYAFGCVSALSGGNFPPQGLLGLGRGPLSLLSQTGPRYGGVFSYCLPSFRSYYYSGSLRLGPDGQPKSIKSTPLLKNPRRPSLYYVNLTGINVGKVRVPIAPQFLAFDPTSGAGTIIDSGTTITRFVQPVYEALRDEYRKQVPGPFTSLGAFDTCFDTKTMAIAPAVTFRFSGMDLELPMENSLIHSSSGSQACLAMAAAPSNVNSVLNVIANLQQQNLRILVDVAGSRLGIAREQCS